MGRSWASRQDCDGTDLSKDKLAAKSCVTDPLVPPVATALLLHGPPYLPAALSTGAIRPSAGGQACLYNHSSYQSSSAHQGLVHASHHFQSIVPSSLLSHCSSQLPLRCAQGHHSSTGPCLEKTLPLHITPSANVSHIALLSCSSPSAFYASPPSARLLPASLMTGHSVKAAAGQ